MDFGLVLVRGQPDAGAAAGPSVGDEWPARGSGTARTGPPAIDGPVKQMRESDGLEPILRLGALWQRVGVEPMRQTHQGTLYKRDRDRLTEDPVLACSIADAPEAARPTFPSSGSQPGPLMSGSLNRDPDSGERLLAAPAEFWTDNAVHLAADDRHGVDRSATRGNEVEEDDRDPSAATAAVCALPYLRVALITPLLSALDEERTGRAAIDDSRPSSRQRWPAWERLSLADEA